jgi:hypothetical protein
MKKTILAYAVLSVLNGVTYAAPASEITGDTNPVGETSPSTPASANSTTPPSPVTNKPTAENPSPTQSSVPAVDKKAPAPDMSANSSVPDTIDCSYQLSSQTTQVDPLLVTKWATKAAEQSFTFESTQLDAQIEKLKACYTPQGWQSFYDALKKSGNLTAITSQSLSVSAMVDGEANISENNGNEWKLTIPLQVVYQNKQQKLTQSLSLDVLVGRKASGDLGIMQMVAVPKQNTTTSVTPAQNSSTQPTTEIKTESKTTPTDTKPTMESPVEPAVK